MIHTGKRAFMCDICDKAFTTKENLHRHRMVRTGERPFICDISNKTFT